jgi:hypothetical protein
MRTVRFFGCILAMVVFTSIPAGPQESHPPKTITVVGKVTRVMAIGAETTGWSLELKREITLEGKKMKSVEISGPAGKFEKLVDQRVKAKGTLTHRRGVERPDHLVLDVSSIAPVKTNPTK